MTDTLAQVLRWPLISLRLWHPVTLELIWPTTGLTVPRSYQEALADEAPRWVFATIDKAGDGGVITTTPDHRRIWSGEMRIATNDPWAQVETRGTDPIAAVRAEFYAELAASYEANPPRAEEIAGPIEVNPTQLLRSAGADPWFDGWHPNQWWRVIMSDGTVWCGTTDEIEARAALEQIRQNAVTAYPPGFPDGIVYGPDAGAKLQRVHSRTQHQWRDA